MFYLLSGIALLYIGAEACVKGSSRLARSLRISALAIGLTIVAFGTSLPEASVSIAASTSGESAISLGNIIGSNIINIGLILGLASLISPLKIDSSLVRRDVPLMLISCLLLFAFLRDNRIERAEGAVFFVLFLLFVVYSLTGKRDTARLIPEEGGGPGRNGIRINICLTAAGLVLLASGGYLFVKGAAAIAEALGISQWVIGLTVVAIGTSLPELATAVVASFRKKDDIASGNIVGSCMFNILFVLGAAALINPIVVDEGSLRFQLIALFAFTLLLIPFMRTQFTIRRWEGGILLVMYIAYLASFGIIR